MWRSTLYSPVFVDLRRRHAIYGICAAGKLGSARFSLDPGTPETYSGAAHIYVSSRVICYMHTTCPIYVVNYCKKPGKIVCSKNKVIRTYMITTL